MTTRTKSQPAAAARSLPWYSRLLYMLAAVAGVGGIAVALWQLATPLLPLRVERVWLGAIPVTIYTSAGPAPRTSPPHGNAVVIAHGFAASQQIMQPFAVTLARAGFTALTFDFPGHGQHVTPISGALSDSEGRYAQLKAALDPVVALARQRGSAQVALLGHSMGSEAVTRYAQEHPEIAATVAVSLVYDEVTPASPRNLLVLTGAWEGGLLPIAMQVADQAAGGSGQPGQTYGNLQEGSGRRVVLVPDVEHIGVLFSQVSMEETVAWLRGAFAVPSPPSGPIYIDVRAPWLGLLYLAATLLFWPLSLIMGGGRQPATRAVAASHLAPAIRGRAWWLLALLPALLAPVILRLLPVQGALPILVGGPLAFLFLIYGALTSGGLLLARWLSLHRAADRKKEAPAPPVADPTRPAASNPADSAGARMPAISRPPSGITVFRQRFLVYTAAALLLVGYVFLSFGVPTQLFGLNYFPPPQRLPVFAAVFAALLPYFLADEALTRGAGAPRGAYLITKLAFIANLGLAIALNPSQLFFLILIAPVLVAYFTVYGLMSGIVYRRTGAPAIAALANAAIFAWVVAVTFPLVA